MSDQTPEPDEFGRYRVTDKDTGHRLSIPASALPHGNFNVLKQPASNPLTGDALPPEHGVLESLSSNPTSGQSAESKKEKTHG